ncbi:MAG: hypothetical protein ACMUIE_03910 [Thermoplasmatota archaeon]
MLHAIKVAYDGTRFHGSQRQGSTDPGSVEGSIVEALREIEQFDPEEEWPVKFASRTDSGVSALGNVFSVRSDMDPENLLKALNANMEGIWCWAHGLPRETQNIRWASSRWYRYHLPASSLVTGEVSRLDKIMKTFLGEHDFTNFSKPEDEKNTVTIIEKAEVIDLSGSGDLVAVDIVGSRFLWQQVRRMVGAGMAVLEGRLSSEDVKVLMDPSRSDVDELRKEVRTMPPFGLILMDVHFKDIAFSIVPEALELALERSKEEAWKAATRVLIDSALRSLPR